MPKFHEIYERRKAPFRMKDSSGAISQVTKEGEVIWVGSRAPISPISLATLDWEVIEEETPLVLEARRYGFGITGYCGRQVVSTHPGKYLGAWISFPTGKTLTDDQARRLCKLLGEIK